MTSVAEKQAVEWKSLCASSVGSSHMVRGIPLEDCGIASNSPFPILVVADGAGSAKHSDIGSETAVKASIDFIVSGSFEIKNKKKCLEVYRAVRRALRDKARELKLKFRTLATTLQIVYVLNDTVYWMQIGDGLILVQKNGFVGCVSIPTKGEFANQTVFITSKSAHTYLQYGKFSIVNCEGIMAMTDGIMSVLVQEDDLSVAPICSSLIRQVKEKDLTGQDVEHLLKVQLVHASSDDKTLGFLVPVVP